MPGTKRLVKSMIEMGHGMGLIVTAEGVETEAEKETITRLGWAGLGWAGLGWAGL